MHRLFQRVEYNNKQVLNFQEISLKIVYPVKTFQWQDPVYTGHTGMHTSVAFGVWKNHIGFSSV